MVRAPSVSEQRRHPRVKLRLPVRLRWQGPLGPVLEVCETLEASRQGFLVRRETPCPDQSNLWVIFPYEPKSPSVLPETPACVVRVKKEPAGDYLIAIRLAPPEQPNGGAPQTERRKSKRIAFAVPIRIRADGSPWFEEAMTANLSDEGVLFETLRLYSPGELLRVRIPCGKFASRGEVRARVVRVVNPQARGTPSAGVAVALETSLPARAT